MSKSIAKNAVFNMGYNAVSVIFPLVTSAYVARTLGASGVGEVSSAQNLATYFTMIATLGIPSYGVRAIAQARIHKEECNRTFSELFVINLFSTVFSLACYAVLILSLDKTLFSNPLHAIFASLIAMSIFNIEWLYQGFEEYKYITIRSILIKIISFILIFLFVKTEDDVNYYAIVICFGSVGNYLLNLSQLKKYVSITFKGLDLKRHFKPIITFFAAVIAVEVYTLLDVTMLTYMCHPENVGYYSNASKIVKIVANTITAIGAVLLPRLSLYFVSRNEKQIKKLISNFFDVITMFSSTKEVQQQFAKAIFKKKFRAEHSKELDAYAESVKYFREENDGKLPSLKSLKKRKEELTNEIAERKRAYAPLKEESRRLEIASDNVYSIFRKTNEMKSDLAWKREWEAKVREKARQEQARQEQRERQPKRKKRSYDMSP